MKYITDYITYNESNIENSEDILQYCDDILLELNDNNFIFKINLYRKAWP